MVNSTRWKSSKIVNINGIRRYGTTKFIICHIFFAHFSGKQEKKKRNHVPPNFYWFCLYVQMLFKFFFRKKPQLLLRYFRHIHANTISSSFIAHIIGKTNNMTNLNRTKATDKKIAFGKRTTKKYVTYPATA